MYVRFTATDHLWPDAGEIERFRRFAANLPKDAWLHFHCVAGEGRTTAFMTMYDMLKNPDVPYEDIVLRQLRIGGVYTPFWGRGFQRGRSPIIGKRKLGWKIFIKGFKIIKKFHHSSKSALRQHGDALSRNVFFAVGALFCRCMDVFMIY